jgi:undecaprenyl-phosphate 4-deoxy-4-formamido-L-arabinose transferase
MQDIEAISVVIPAYNSEKSLEPLLERLVPILRARGGHYEIILINDGSRDGSWERINALSREYESLRGIDLSRNYGQHNAVLCGIRAARTDIVVTIDDDLQHPPEEIPALLAKLEEGYDVVYGTPHGAAHGLWRNLASRITKLVLQDSMGASTARQISAFRALRTPLRDAFASYQSPLVSIDVLLTWGTTRFAAFPVQHDQRFEGRSNYTFRKLLTHALSMMTGFSTLPLQLASYVGFAFTLFGFAVLVLVIGRYLVNDQVVVGFPFLASIIAIFSGAQLFALGVMGEYIARIHLRAMDRPTYVVREQVSGGAGATRDA